MEAPGARGVSFRVTVKNTFVEFAEVAQGQSPRRSTSVGCARDLRTPRPLNHVAEDPRPAAPLEEAALQGGPEPAVSTPDAVAHVAASLPPGYSLTLRHEGDVEECAPQAPSVRTSSAPHSCEGPQDAAGLMQIAAALPLGGEVTVTHPRQALAAPAIVKAHAKAAASAAAVAAAAASADVNASEYLLHGRVLSTWPAQAAQRGWTASGSGGSVPLADSSNICHFTTSEGLAKQHHMDAGSRATRLDGPCCVHNALIRDLCVGAGQPVPQNCPFLPCPGNPGTNPHPPPPPAYRILHSSWVPPPHPGPAPTAPPLCAPDFPDHVSEPAPEEEPSPPDRPPRQPPPADRLEPMMARLGSLLCHSPAPEAPPGAGGPPRAASPPAAPAAARAGAGSPAAAGASPEPRAKRTPKPKRSRRGGTARGEPKGAPGTPPKGDKPGAGARAAGEVDDGSKGLKQLLKVSPPFPQSPAPGEPPSLCRPETSTPPVPSLPPGMATGTSVANASPTQKVAVCGSCGFGPSAWDAPRDLASSAAQEKDELHDRLHGGVPTDAHSLSAPPPPPGLEAVFSPTSVARTRRHVRRAAPKVCTACGAVARRYMLPRVWCCFYLRIQHGFDLVPIIIGRQGCNTRSIAEKTGAKVRVRGKGSGHLESGTGREAPTPLMLVVAAEADNRDGFFEAVRLTLQLLGQVESRYLQHCSWVGIRPVLPTYTMGSLPDETWNELVVELGDVLPPRHTELQSRDAELQSMHDERPDSGEPCTDA